MLLSMSLIMAIGPQNAHVLRMGLQRQHLWLTVAVCAVADIALISLGVLGLAQLGGLSDKLLGALVGAGVLFLGVYGWQAFQRFLKPQTPAASADDGATQPRAPAPATPRQAVLSALAFSVLNPHAERDEDDVGHGAHRHREPQVLALQTHAQHVRVLWTDGHDQGHAQQHAGGEGGEAQGHGGSRWRSPAPVTGASVMARSLPQPGCYLNHFNHKSSRLKIA
jgi:hypothetical protein